MDTWSEVGAKSVLRVGVLPSILGPSFLSLGISSPLVGVFITSLQAAKTNKTIRQNSNRFMANRVFGHKVCLLATQYFDDRLSYHASQFCSVKCVFPKLVEISDPKPALLKMRRKIIQIRRWQQIKTWIFTCAYFVYNQRISLLWVWIFLL